VRLFFAFLQQKKKEEKK